MTCHKYLFESANIAVYFIAVKVALKRVSNSNLFFANLIVTIDSFVKTLREWVILCKFKFKKMYFPLVSTF
jgi:hypothetical protein